MNADGQPLTREAAFESHRNFWEGVCSHPEPDLEKQTVLELVASLPADSEPITTQDVQAGIARLRKGTSPGLDNWTAEAIAKLPTESLLTLATRFQAIETTGQRNQVLQEPAPHTGGL